jgi:hypothetical protein
MESPYQNPVYTGLKCIDGWKDVSISVYLYPLILIKNTFHPIMNLFKGNRNFLNYFNDFWRLGEKECL